MNQNAEKMIDAVSSAFISTTAVLGTTCPCFTCVSFKDPQIQMRRKQVYNAVVSQFQKIDKEDGEKQAQGDYLYLIR